MLLHVRFKKINYIIIFTYSNRTYRYMYICILNHNDIIPMYKKYTMIYYTE